MNRLQTDQQTDRVTDQLLELLEWLFATKNERRNKELMEFLDYI